MPDIVDELHAAEDRADRLERRLDLIWQALQLPYDWSADTPEEIANLMEIFGYRPISGRLVRLADERFVCWSDFEHRYPRVADRLRSSHTPPREHRLACESHEDGDEADCGCWCHQ